MLCWNLTSARHLGVSAPAAYDVYVGSGRHEMTAKPPTRRQDWRRYRRKLFNNFIFYFQLNSTQYFRYTLSIKLIILER